MKEKFVEKWEENYESNIKKGNEMKKKIVKS